MTQAPGPSRPTNLDFLEIGDPGKATVLYWDPPGPKCRGFIVFATNNAFPSNMAGPLLLGKMKQFIDEERLEASAKDFKIARSERFYGVVWIDDEDNIFPVTGLREPAEAKASLIDLKAFAATQVRTYLRARYLPGIVEFRDAVVHVWVRDVEPNNAALNKMTSGEFAADFVLPAKGDGFIDTVTEAEWKKHFVALVLGKDGIRRPLELELGGYVRLEDPQFLERDGKKKYDQIVELVRNQLEVDLQRKSLTLDEAKQMLKRADDLAPFHPVVIKLKQKARERFNANF